MIENKSKTRDYLESEIETMTAAGIYMLMEEKGADVFGLWSADKHDILKSYGEQIGFKSERNINQG